MAVKLRLARHGKKKQPYYRLVATASENPRDGRFLEQVGTYDPRLNPPAVSLRRDRIRHWLDHGATATPTMQRLIDRYFDGEDTIRKVTPRPKVLKPTAKAPEAEAAPAPVEAAPAPAPVEAAPAPAPVEAAPAPAPVEAAPAPAPAEETPAAPEATA
jgi:small subunit ribosomal protein S16